MTAPDSVLASTGQEEAVSLAYVQALAAKAGYVTASMNFDMDGIDIEVKAGGAMRPAIGIQLKATINLGLSSEGIFKFPLKVRNYSLLRIPTQVPRILVVLSLPEESKMWIEHTPEALIIRKCAYWVSLAGFPETSNAATVSIPIPEANVLDESGLIELLEKSRTGSLS
jgi:Domain of unknown function (DUF4365)